MLGAAIALGDQAKAEIGGATSEGADLFNAAISVGPGSETLAQGYLSVAAGVGQAAVALAGGYVPYAFGNVALNLGGTFTASLNNTIATGVGALAVNFFGHSSTTNGNEVVASGILTVAANLFGGSRVFTGSGVGPATSPQSGIATLAFNVFGNGNTVSAGNDQTGSLGGAAVAGAIGQNGVTVEQQAPGVNLYTRVALGAAATGAKAAANSAAVARTHRIPRATAATSTKK